MLSYYWKRLKPFFAIYLLTGILTTAALAFTCFFELDLSFPAILKTGLSSLVFLLMELAFFIVPFTLYLAVLPSKMHNGKVDKYITFCAFAAALYLLIFKSVSEYFFWQEFFSRFNFIAVDYLVYTQEVIENIYQSYPLIKILAAAFLVTCALSFLFVYTLSAAGRKIPPFKNRIGVLGGNILLCIIIACFTTPYLGDITNNRLNNELAKSGVYGFVYAFFHNELDYNVFYPTIDNNEAQKILAEKTALGKDINPSGEEKTPNVILVLMESMSEKYLQPTDGNPPLAPCLTKLAKYGVYFPNTYATRTRTVRGIEALTLSLPPLPGMSVVRRKGNENLYTVGNIFRDRGYTAEFIYGGVGFFDNMNYFFKNNGFEITDKTYFSKDEIHFSNAWGVSDEDLFSKAIKQADGKYKENKKFFQFIITTSNHRPYTYPQGKIDIPSGTGRDGAVKYADYAIGQFIKEASSKPWFDNTVFVFIADHEAGSAGKDELNPNEHKIPFIVYAPKIIKPRYYEKAISQIDALPTLLALLNLKYKNRFFGSNAAADDYKTRYFLINYQKIGYVEDDILTILKPVKKANFYKLPLMSEYGDKKSNEKYYKTAVSFFQQAENWKSLMGTEKREAPFK